MNTSPPSKLNWFVIARGIFPFYFLAVVLDILLHEPPYQVAQNNADLTYQLFGLILGWLPLVILVLLGAERARQILPESSRGRVNSLGLLALFTAAGMKNAFTLALWFMPSHAISPTALSIFIQAAVVFLKWTGLGLDGFALISKGIDPSRSSRSKRAILIILKLILIALALCLLILDINGLLISQGR